MDAFERAVLGAMKRLGVERGARVIVGFSGGPDSTALLAALAATGFAPLALHVNHGLRGRESDRDERQARKSAAKVGAGFESVRVQVRGPSLEAAARREREGSFAAAALRAGSACVATGHTLDDQAETVLYRAARGAGTRGLRGILPSRDLVPGIRLVRPLLGVRRAEVLAYLRRHRFPVVVDSSNADPRFARNRIRRDVLPALEAARPGAAVHLAALAKEAAGLTEIVEKLARIQHRLWKRKEGLMSSPLSRSPSAVRHEILRRELPAGHALTQAHREAFDRLFEDPPRRIALLGSGWTANRRGKFIRIVGPQRAPDPEEILTVPGACRMARSGREFRAAVGPCRNAIDLVAERAVGEEVLDADAVAAPLTVGAPRRGERMRPLGAPGSRKIADILSDLGVPRSRRSEELVVRSADGAIVWLFGRRIAHHARVTDTTRRALRLSAR